ncbi:amidohydrolase family protein [Iodidimonas sp. SYSU 1G8]|uniref:N-acyl-D-amino-acid deacylase family protein n=1 Tax=Iodidimonas sp. SYSU 1G8 TaxID=3133967 RepID=UPI0031FF28B8
MSYDIKIVGGTIIDGTGAPGYRGDVGIKDGRIVALGDAPEPAARTIDAGGRVVCPGFVDIHTHYDAQIMWDRMLTISPWHGVTTAVVGNCGFGVAPTRPDHRRLILQTLENVEGMSLEALEAGLGDDWGFETFPEYLDAIERKGMAINLGVLIGHTPLRMYVMGEDAVERAATPDEVARMRDIVREALQAGAVGFATSKAITHWGYAGKPVPSRLAELDEIEELASPVGEVGGMVQVNVGPGFYLKELSAIARRTGKWISWTAMLTGLFGPGGHRKQLDRTADLVEQGLNIIPQVACRPLNFEFQFETPFPFEAMPMFAELGAGTREARIARFSDPAWRQQMRESLIPVLEGWDERTTIAVYPPEPALEERNLVDVARERGVDATDLALDMALATDLKARFRTAVLNTDEAAIGEMLHDPNTVLGLSDAGAHASQLCDACFSTHLLGHWVRDKGALTLEQGVRALTSRPAEVFGITDRGRLAVGVAADVVVFDPATVGPAPIRRVYDLPGGADRLQSDAIGIDAVIVNGTLLRYHGTDHVDPAGALPGRLLRNGHASSAARLAAE